jgi:hypothetical protein
MILVWSWPRVFHCFFNWNFPVFEACTCRLFFCVNAVGCEWRMLQLFRQTHTRSHILTSLFIANWQHLLATGWEASRKRGNKTNLISLSSLTWPLDYADCGWFLAFIVRVEIIRHQISTNVIGLKVHRRQMAIWYIYCMILLASLQPAPAAGPAVIWHLSSLIAATPGCCLLW